MHKEMARTLSIEEKPYNVPIFGGGVPYVQDAVEATSSP
jgi:hypothetical protein